MQFPGRKICRRRSERNPAGRRRNRKIENSSSNSSTSGIYPTNVEDLESDEDKRARIRAQTLADKSYASKEATHLDGLKKLKQKFNRAIVLVLKHLDAQINLDLHQFLKSDPIKRLEPEAKYKSLRDHFSERWGPHSSLDVTKIK